MKRIFWLLLVLMLLPVPGAASAGGEGEASPDPKAEAYRQAEAYLEAGEYEAAEMAFTKLLGYGDSREKLGEAKYLHGLALREKGDHLASYEMLIANGSYGDSKAQAMISLQQYCEGLLHAKVRSREKLAENAYYFEWLKGDEATRSTYEAWLDAIRIGIGDSVNLRFSGAKDEKYSGDTEIVSITVTLVSKDAVEFTFTFSEHTKKDTLLFKGIHERVMQSDRTMFNYKKPLSAKNTVIVQKVKLGKVLSTKYVVVEHYSGSRSKYAYRYTVLNLTAARKILEVSTGR